MISIRSRFLIISLVSVTLALALASAAMVRIFTDNYTQRVQAELSGHINRLAAALQIAADGKLQLPQSPADNRFLTPYGGLYWQINDSRFSAELRSPSLFDYALPLPEDKHPPGVTHRYRLPGPEGADVIVQERALTVATPTGPRVLRIAVAIDAAEIDSAQLRFGLAILPYVAALAVFLVLMTLVQLWAGLKPLGRIAGDVDAIRQRRANHLPGPYPRELEGLAMQLNRLIEMQTNAIDKARTRASDLAHGLKTPLTVLANNAHTLRERGESDMADELDALADAMLAHVDHELARARIAASPDLRRADAPAAKIIDDIIRTLNRTADGEALQWTADVPEDLSLPIDPHDFRELIGNLLENASKWARTTVAVRATSEDGACTIEIADDGPGAPSDKLDQLTQRGLRLDHQKAGSGLGLAIVKEIVTVYGARLTLANRPFGGFLASVAFPAA